jgi:hypothetical protein
LGIAPLVPVPVYAAYDYYIPITISAVNSAVSFHNVAVVVSINNSQLVDLGYIDADALNTSVYLGATGADYLLRESEVILFVEDLLAGQTLTYNYRLGEEPGQTGFSLVTATSGGWAFTWDSAALEPGDNFSLNVTGLVDTGEMGSIVEKDEALWLGVESGNLSARLIYDFERENVTPTVNATWTVVDVSAYVPSWASGVILSPNTTTFSLTTGSVGAVRPAGSGATETQDCSVNGGFFWVPFLGDNRTIEVYCDKLRSQWYLSGYTGDSWHGFGSYYNNTDLAHDGWYDVAVPEGLGVPGNASALVVYVVNTYTGTTTQPIGFRYAGDVAPPLRGMPRKSHGMFLVPIADNSTYQRYLTSTSSYNRIYIVGYVEEDGFEYYRYSSTAANGVEVEDANVWEPIDFSKCPDGVTATYVVQNTTGGRVGMSRHPEDDSGYTTTTLNISSYVFPLNATQHTEFKWNNADTPTEMLHVGNITDFYPITQHVGLESLVTSGDHAVNLTADGSDARLWVDGVIKDTESLGGHSVHDALSTWDLQVSNVSPYLTLVEYSVDGTPLIRYAPKAMIDSYAIINELSPGIYNGFQWLGNNPEGIEITVGALLSAESYTADVEGGGSEPPTMLEPFNMNIHEDTGADMSTKPLYPAVHDMAEAMDWTDQMAYGVLSAFVGVALGFAGLIAMGSVWGFAVMFVPTVGAAASAEMLPLWFMIISIMFVLFLAYVYRNV